MKCYLCNNKATIKDTIGNVEYHYCMNCYLRYLETKESVRDVADMEVVNALIEQVKKEKDQEYKAILEAILKRKDYKNDINSVIQAIKE